MRSPKPCHLFRSIPPLVPIATRPKLDQPDDDATPPIRRGERTTREAAPPAMRRGLGCDLANSPAYHTDDVSTHEQGGKIMIFAIYYKESPRGRVNIGRIEAPSESEALRLATNAVRSAYPKGCGVCVVEARKSPLPVKNADGRTCTPALVY